MKQQYANRLYSATAWLLQHLCYDLCRFYFSRLRGWRIVGNPQLVHVRKPVLLAAAPHLSHTDVVLVPASVPRRLLPVRWLGNRKIFQGRIRAVWFKLWGGVPVNRDPSGSFDGKEISWIVDFALPGRCIGVFPECCLVGGRFGDPQRDLIVAALKRKISVLPVALTGNVQPERSLIPSSADPIREVLVGEPLADAAELLDVLGS